ncbi:MAG: gliding motility-associated C-terminal domain-containing protein [Bacteroidetes bacterium]|nr:gliding motility-associated C-terminal domain-containing protein [Bacteroidota bacterium]MBS1648536.1 gliding motility-associated C-terminal domain-containing protein [Bacteroidota bacterium]
MKKFLLLITLLLFIRIGFAAHLKGGWISYQYISTDNVNKTNKYSITINQYLLCTSSGAQIDASVALGVFDAVTNNLLNTITVNKTATDILNKTSFNPCLSPVPTVCYRIDKYTTTVDLPFNTNGYTLAVQRCCRIAGIINVSNSDQVGITYTNTIPGTINGSDYSKNSSPVFAQKDTAVVCYKTNFTFDFSATDADGDSLSYTFCNGLIGGSSLTPTPNPPSAPPFSSVPYNSGYTGGTPLGAAVTINPITGIISGVAPSAIGDYVIAVCANEYRGGVLIGTTKKEIHITVANCSVSAASLKPSYITCNGFTMSFQNESTSSNIISYAWDFGETSYTTDTSTNSTPTYTYHDTGVYVMKLKVTATGGCQDSTTATVRVFPGFTPDFSITGNCYLNPYLFKDLTYTKYGVVNNWSWSFGDPTSGTLDTTSIQNPSHLYATSGNKTITLTVANSKGCVDVITKPLSVNDKPSLSLPFHDTLICSIDTLPLIANTNGGIITWTPATRIINPISATPLVYPTDTTVYHVTVNNNGCINEDSIKVNVLQFITVDAGRDTGICKTDTIRLNPTSHALSYKWIASTGVFVDSVKQPLIQPLVTTKYYVTANLGKCQDKDSVLVKVAPYPSVMATKDTTLCFGSRVQLNATIIGSSFNWKPSGTLLNANSLNPIAGPNKTTQYIITVTDTIGCPKSVSDTVTVKIIPLITVNAGNDTSIVINQPLQLHATVTDTTGMSFIWSPSTGLDNPNISHPIAILNTTTDSIRYIVKVTLDSAGCYGMDDIWVKVFKTDPDIFVPSAFTPNNDGLNDILKPIPVGIVTLNYFKIYNRWGQLLYITSEIGQGWDGNVGGIVQPSGTYIYITQGIDYTGKTIFRKGTIVLIR